MITGIRIKNYRGIRDSGQIAMGPFHVLIGANGSGKSTFLDAFEFIKDCIQIGALGAMKKRGTAFEDMTFGRRGGAIVIRVDLNLDIELSYQFSLVPDSSAGVRVDRETLLAPDQEIIARDRDGHSRFFEPRQALSFTFPAGQLALAHTPQDFSALPIANKAAAAFAFGITLIDLYGKAMRWPWSPLSPDILQADGGNLARVVGRLKREDPAAFQFWLANLHYALDGIQDVGWAKREADNFEYITIRQDNGLECPSWLLSDGTLRTLALTILPHVPMGPGLLLVEEPETGVHPRALEIILGALQAVPDRQVLVTTQSPLVVRDVGKDCLLCFTRDEEGIHIRAGNDHPALADWDGTPDLETVFAARVLG
ncbi:MAG: ATP-binding protein [Acidobacteria bacterium]|nr:ATP-binding protein [Acidobacteriota bacterium]